MPANTGTPPRAEFVDLRFRNNHVVRNTSPSKWRWTVADPKFPPNYDFDIVDYQRSRGAA